MPIIPAFDPSTGASGGPPSGGGGGGTTPIWLNLDTQIVYVSSTSATVNVTLSTPTNGVAPYRYTVFPGHQTSTGSSLTISGNVLEASRLSALNTNVSNTGSQCYRVICRDSAGNLGIGALILINKVLSADTDLLIERVLDWDEDPEGYLFSARSSPSAAAASYQPSGNGFGYPRPATVAQVEGDRWANTPPGGCFLQLYRRTNYPASGQNQMVYLLLRRKVDMSGGASWVEAQDFLKFDSLNNLTPTVPLGTSSTTTYTVETNSVTGLPYQMEWTAHANPAGVAPVTETASYTTGGPLLLSTSASGASTRLIRFDLKPANPSFVTQRYGSLSLEIGGMIRTHCKVSLTGDYSWVDFRFGNGLSNDCFGLRIRGNQGSGGGHGTIGGQPSVQVSGSRLGGVLVDGNWVRRSEFVEVDIGVDMITLGGQAFVAVYPWDPAWTDFPEYASDSFTPANSVPRFVGPMVLQTNLGNVRPSLAYGGDSSNVPMMLGATTNETANRWGVSFGVSPGNNASGGAAGLEVYAVKWYWKMLNLGDRS